MSEHRWSKFWWQDYEGDDALRVVSLAAQGLWMRMLCAMHKGVPYGHLTINGRATTMPQLAILASVSERKVAGIVQELEKAGVFSVNENGMIFCRRMVRDREISERGQQDGKRGGNPALNPKRAEGITPPLNPGGYPLEAEADTEAEADSKGRAHTPRSATPRRQAKASRLPADWQPSEPEYAGVDAHRTLARFRDYWTAQPGQKGVKADWQATWRNWCRREADQPQPKLHTQPPAEQDRRILAAVGLNFDDPEPVARRIAQ